MKASEFCYWLQGFFELRNVGITDGDKTMDSLQVALVEKHLALVFAHELDKTHGNEQEQQKLNAIHNPEKITYRC